jgi:pSer/pThr/pTyr-binding forkhead associated (FHA) protein
MCGHESPAGSSFCLNCGSSLAQALAPTQLPAQGLPGTTCGVCRGENPPGMKYCRNCGSALPQAAPRPPAAPMPAAVAALGGPMPGMLSGPIGGFPSPPPPPGGGGAGPVGGLPPRVSDALLPTMLPQQAPPPSMAPPMALRIAQGSTIACPRCGTQTPIGFPFCQQCGLHLEAVAPTEAATGPRPRPSPGRLEQGIDPHAGTLAQDDGGPAPPPTRAAPPARLTPGSWGTAVLVNRDGSDGQRYPLSGEYLIVGRAGADIAFEDDRFLGRQHARLERGGDGTVKVHPMDPLNGVFRKTDAPVELVDGMIILVGREVLRYERVEAEEAKVYPLVRHGVALFGSPPREPWGRLLQIVPSGGHRDVRHLVGDEVVLGREEGEIVFRDDAFLSRRHAAMTWDGKRAQITDLGSSNGTFVRITGPTVLRNGDHVRMGDQLLRIELGR